MAGDEFFYRLLSDSVRVDNVIKGIKREGTEAAPSSDDRPKVRKLIKRK
jgi:hypothetical protein